MPNWYVCTATIAFAVGIWIQNAVKNTTLVVFLAVLFLGVSITLLHKKSGELSYKIPIILIAILFCFLGVWRASTVFNQDRALINKLTTIKTERFHGRVVDEPDKRPNYTNLVIAPDIEPRAKILARVSAFSHVRYNDEVLVSGILERPTNFTDNNTGITFDYKNYLNKSGIYYIVPEARVKIIKHHNSFFSVLIDIKERYIDSVNKSLPMPESALGTGITIGNKRALGRELLDVFRKTGIIHIVVLSGFNISIIASAIFYIFAFLPMRTRIFISLTLITLFVFLVGINNATVVRAGIMGAIALLGIAVGREYSALRALFLTALLMIAINPKILLYDISFQLSFMATLGIILATDAILSKLTFLPDIFKIRELTAVTISANLAVLPLIIYYMGEVSLVSIPMNLLIVPLIGPAMLFTLLTALATFIMPAVATIPAYMAYLLLHTIIFLAEWFAQLPYASAVIGNLGIGFVIIGYIFRFIVVYHQNALAQPTS